MPKTSNQPKKQELVETRANDGHCPICNARVDGRVETPFRDFTVLVCNRHPNPAKE